ncbi:alpha/beta fold hydrolase [Cellulomonas sp. S1-8]|uniref:alpha/beta fold hydrolase n=1 Tax=Cellulomonas sp. S1-8 TaxID=2904790 RepID=UPI002244B786|nr:alpha/beta hydrolase [Cellulomonas sp. S1-8]UZN02407.1 alpha/beta hydrolase [Cellulomonas sp. S1-8]
MTVSTRTLDVPGAVLTYDVANPATPSAAPALLLIGSPMGAGGFGTLRSSFDDRVVVTYDPRGVERSTLAPGAAPTAPGTHGDDLHRLVEALGGGPVDVFASSGGAVNALAWVAAHPEDVGTLVAHEPPLPSALPDAAEASAAMLALHETYLRQGWGHAMAGFIALVSHEGPVPADWAQRPAPDPAAFGLPTQDDGTREDPMFAANMVTLNTYAVDVDAVRAAPTRVVVAVGAESGETLAARGARAVAAALGGEAVVMPGDHGAFLGGEYGQTGVPDQFAPALRTLLAG